MLIHIIRIIKTLEIEDLFSILLNKFISTEEMKKTINYL